MKKEFNPVLEYKCPTTGGIRYVGVDPLGRMYSTNYFRYNGGWSPCVPVCLKDIRAVVDRARREGFEEV